MTKVKQNTGNNEWFTPPEIVESARKVMGSIDLDPASNDKAQTIVNAKIYYTKEDNGLTKPWMGNIWCNPPYARGLVDAFVNKLSDSSDVGNWVFLVNNITETKAGNKLLNLSDAVCFPKGRIAFLNEDLVPVGKPIQGQMICYGGPFADKFLTEFLKFGACLKR